jgi:probable HAF family extracellular repeat protein
MATDGLADEAWGLDNVSVRVRGGPQDADVVLLPEPPAAPGYTLRSLTARAINNTGVAVGSQYRTSDNSSANDGVRWNLAAGTIDLPFFDPSGEYWYSSAIDVNDEGHLVGNFWCCEGLGAGWLRRGDEIVWTTTFTERDSWTVALNAKDRMAVNFPPGFDRAYRFKPKTHYKEIKPPAGLPDDSGPNTVGADINDAGHIVGRSEYYPPEAGGAQYIAAFHWDGSGRPDALPSLGGRRSRALAVNEADDVAGESELPEVEGALHAVLWRGDELLDLGTLGGSNSSAAALDESGLVVGSSETELGSGETHAFLWRDGEMLDLNEMIQPGWTRPLVAATGMNDLGQIVCNADTPLGLRAALVTLWARDVTADVRVDVDPVKRKGRKAVQKVFVENTSGAPIAGPISLILDDLAGGTLAQSSGTTGEIRPPAGSPYLTQSGSLPSAGRRARMAFTLSYSSVGASGVSFTPRVVAGIGRR